MLQLTMAERIYQGGTPLGEIQDDAGGQSSRDTTF
jgi:hypothetical protein